MPLDSTNCTFKSAINDITLRQPRLAQLNYSYTLHGLIISFSHGGHLSKHSHCHTWLLAEQFFSVALSVLCSLSDTYTVEIRNY